MKPLIDPHAASPQTPASSLHAGRFAEGGPPSGFSRYARRLVAGTIAVASFGALSAAPSVSSADASTGAGLVTNVDFGQTAKVGSFHMAAPKVWQLSVVPSSTPVFGLNPLNPQTPSATWVEAQRTVSLLVLLDPSTKDVVEIDVLGKKMYESDAQGLKRVSYAVLNEAFAPAAVAGPVTVPVPNPGSPNTIAVDEVDMPDADKAAVLHWIQVKTTEVELPFCWRQSATRGVGTVPGRVADCPSGYTNNGATCGRGADTYGAPSKLASCPSGYTNMGFSCYMGPSTYGKGCTTIFKKYSCGAGYTDDGCFCGRGASSLGPSSLTCGTGYHKSSITERCVVDCRDGYTNTGETCFKSASTLGMDSMTCNAGETRSGARCYPTGSTCGAGHEEDAGLCYPTCPAGFHGEGPVCWQNCDAGMVSCGAGCATTSAQCGMVVGAEVLSSLTVAANIATLGLASPETGAAGEAERSSGSAAGQGASASARGLNATSTVGKLFLKAIKYMQTIKPANLKADATVVKTIWAAKTGTKVKKSVTAFRVAGELYQDKDQFATAYAADFANQTSPAINATIDAQFAPNAALFIKKQWALQSMTAMQAAQDFEIAQDVLTAVSIVDISGVTGLVASFTKPICQDATPFPTLSQSYK